MVSLLESVYHAFSIFADWFTVQFRWLIYLIYHPFSLIDLSCEQVALLLNDLFIFNHHSFLCRLVGRRCESRFSGVRLVLGRRWANPDLRVGRLTSLLRTSGISEFWRGGWVPASACSNGLTSQRLGRRNSGATSQQRQHFLASGVKTNSGTPSQAHVFNCRAFATGGSGENDFTRSSYIFTIQVLVSCLLFRLLQRHIVITVPHNKIRHLHFSVFAFYFPTHFAFSLFFLHRRKRAPSQQRPCHHPRRCTYPRTRNSFHTRHYLGKGEGVLGTRPKEQKIPVHAKLRLKR